MLLKDKKSITITSSFQNALDDSGRKPSKILVDHISEFYHRSMKSWVHINDIGIYSTNNERKSVIAERFIRTLKTKIYKHMTVVSKNVCIGRLDEIVDKYNKTYHRAINMKPIDVKVDTYIDYSVEHNGKNPKFKVGGHVRISKYKNTFAKGGLNKSL